MKAEEEGVHCCCTVAVVYSGHFTGKVIVLLSWAARILSLRILCSDQHYCSRLHVQTSALDLLLILVDACRGQIDV